MTISTLYGLGDIVYVKTDEDQKPRMVIEIKILPGHSVCYLCSLGSISSDYYEIELSSEKDVIKSIT